jgi:hypothetical protein
MDRHCASTANQTQNLQAVDVQLGSLLEKRLRSAYRALFKCVKVGAEKPNGHRDFEFILNEDSSRGQGLTGGFGGVLGPRQRGGHLLNKS